MQYALLLTPDWRAGEYEDLKSLSSSVDCCNQDAGYEAEFAALNLDLKIPTLDSYYKSRPPNVSLWELRGGARPSPLTVRANSCGHEPKVSSSVVRKGILRTSTRRFMGRMTGIFRRQIHRQTNRDIRGF